MWVPRGTPDAVIETLNKAVRDALADPKVRQRFADLGQEIPPADQRRPRAGSAISRRPRSTSGCR